MRLNRFYQAFVALGKIHASGGVDGLPESVVGHTGVGVRIDEHFCDEVVCFYLTTDVTRIVHWGTASLPYLDIVVEAEDG